MFFGNKGSSEVVAAFYAGKKLTRGNHGTNGREYLLFNNCIARRLELTEPEQVAFALLKGHSPRMLEYSMAGWDSHTTRSTLSSLGLRVHTKDGTPYINGREVNCYSFYTPAEIEALPLPEVKKRREPTFVQMTAPLFV